MKTINLVFALVILLSACKKPDDIEPSCAVSPSAGRFADPSNSINSNPCVSIKVDSVKQLFFSSPELIEYMASARYQSLDTNLTNGVIDWTYPILLKTYKKSGARIRYAEISYRLFESMVYHNDLPLYRQLIVHAVFNMDSVTKDYAIVIEHFNCLFDLFETYAFYRDDVPFYGDHTYLNISGDTLDRYVMWNDTLKYESYPNHTIDYYNTPINYSDLESYNNCYHAAMAPIRVVVIPGGLSSSTIHLSKPVPHAYHWYPIIDRLYTPLAYPQWIDIDGGIVEYLN